MDIALYMSNRGPGVMEFSCECESSVVVDFLKNTLKAVQTTYLGVINVIQLGYCKL